MMDLELTEALQSADSIEALLAIAEKYTKSIGFDYFCYGHREHAPYASAKLYLQSNYPEIWQSTYDENQFAKTDPTIEHALKSTIPLIWSEKNFSSATAFYEGATSHGIRYGWSQAIRSAEGLSMLTLSRATEPVSDVEMNANMPRLLWFNQVISNAFQKFALSTKTPGKPVTLTSREAEVIRWTADGKTSFEISVILGIAERTVNFHLNNVMSKLDTHNKIAATVKAITLNLI